MTQIKNHLITFLGILLSGLLHAQADYKNFEVSVYTRAREVKMMEDQHWLDSTWAIISSQLHVDKIYLETHRDGLINDKKHLKKLKDFFESEGLKVAGGITYTIDERNYFETFCYTNPQHRKNAQEIIELSASVFDEVILDDFFFTSCKCLLCIEAKADLSWSAYRLQLMQNAAENLIIGPAKAVNPNVKVVIKYPNWYDHFHELGFNLETQPRLFDGIYTGTETRDAVMSDQHLQPYLGYLIFRYFDNLNPGHNGGGWVDTYASKHYDRYAEQLWLTIFAKAPEMTLFEYSAMASPPRTNLIPQWSHEKTSYNYPEFLPIRENETMARAASHALSQVDKIAGELGNPVGIKTYKPFHSDGEDFLQSYFGMIGIPMDLVPGFPEDEGIILLTEQAKGDPGIVEKIKQRLMDGKDVMITSGLLRALQDKGIRDVVNLEYTSGKALVKDFKIGRNVWIEGTESILIPQIEYFTNDSWEIISAMNNGNGWPVLHRGSFGEASLYLLTIPDNFTDLYALPTEVLNELRRLICRSMEFHIEAPAGVAVFVYDNGTFVIESFSDEPAAVSIVFSKKLNTLTNLNTSDKLEVDIIPAKSFWGREISPEKYRYPVNLAPHSFMAFKREEFVK